MKRFSFSVIFLFLGVFVFSFHAAYAASFSLTSDFDEPSTQRDFTATLYIQADSAVNALSGSFTLSPNFEVENISDANSQVLFWVDPPSVGTDQQSFSFSGIFPGGFSGKGKVVTVELKARESGTFNLIEKQDSNVYLNTPDAQMDTVSVDPSVITVTSAATTESIPADTTPPEDFLMTLTRNPAIALNKWIVVFDTEDKGSGIDHYEVAEQKGTITTDYSSLSWHAATSPYILLDQRLRSFIYVKAVDRAGNIRVETLYPQYPATWYDYLIDKSVPILAILILIIGVCRMLWFRKK